ISSSILFSYINKDGLKNRANSLYLLHNEKLEMPKVSNGWCFYNIKDDHSLKVGEKGLECHIGSKQTNAQPVLLFGDSFAGHNIPFWHYIGKELNLNIHAVTTNWCYPSIDAQFTGDKNSTAYQQCMINRKYLENNINKYNVLIFAGRWSDIVQQHQEQSFDNLLKLTNQLHKKVIIMSEPYAFDENISILYKRSLWLHRNFNLNNYSDNVKAQQQKIALPIIQNMAQRYPNTLLLTQTDLFAPNHMAKESIPYSLDGRHLSVFGSLSSEEYFIQQPKYQTLQSFLSVPSH
ncbi:acyltransferase, partial [Acinetobacter bereziniae]